MHRNHINEICIATGNIHTPLTKDSPSSIPPQIQVYSPIKPSALPSFWNHTFHDICQNTMLHLKCLLVEFYDKIDASDLILLNNNSLNYYIHFLKSCDFLSDATDAHILVATMKHFEMTSIDDSPTNNKPSPLTATRAVEKQWLFKMAETIVGNYIVEDADISNQFIGKNICQSIV